MIYANKIILRARKLTIIPSRRKVRRKTLTTNDTSRLSRAQSVSGSPFGSPSSGIQPLPPIQPSEALGSPSTTGDLIDHNASLTIASSPQRSSHRMMTIAASSKIVDTHAVSSGARSSSGRAKVLSRTLTLPTQLSDTLERMRISTEDVSTLSLPSTNSPSRQSLHTEESGIGMEVDEGDDGGSRRLQKKPLATSRRHTARRRAHSLPPAKTEEASDCDADDEGGGFGVAEEEEDGVLMRPVVPIARHRGSRARQSSPDIELRLEGVSTSSNTMRKPPIPLRRSARRKTLGAADGAQAALAISPLLLASVPSSTTARKRSRGRDSMPPPESAARTNKRTRKA